MSKRTLVEKSNLKSIYASQFFHVAAWAFITGQRRNGKEMSEAANDFIDFFDVEDMEVKTLLMIYRRVNQEFKLAASGVREDVASLMKKENELYSMQMESLKNQVCKTIDDFIK